MNEKVELLFNNELLFYLPQVLNSFIPEVNYVEKHYLKVNIKYQKWLKIANFVL